MQKVAQVSQYEQERGKPLPSKLHALVQTRLVAAFYGYEDDFSFSPNLTSS